MTKTPALAALFGWPRSSESGRIHRVRSTKSARASLVTIPGSQERNPPMPCLNYRTPRVRAATHLAGVR